MKHPVFSKAQWIWPFEEIVQNHNTYAQFRKNFVLRSVPARAPLNITADQSYLLYVNGQYVTRGPARGYQVSWPFDKVDIAPFLRGGDNWISVLAYNAGISTFQYLHCSAGGILVAAKWGKFTLHTDGEWLSRVAPDRRNYTGRLSVQQNFQEWVDKRNSDDAWITAKRFSKAQWKNPNCKPFGALPWHGVEPRGIPNLTNNVHPYAAVTATAAGTCMKHWANEENLYVPVFNEIPSTRWRKARGKGESVEIPTAGKGKFQAVTLDFSRPTCGNLLVEVTGAKGGETLDFYFTEGVDDKHAPIIDESIDTGSRTALVHRMTLKRGNNTHEFFQMIGHRYVTVFARETKTPLTLRLRNRETIYPLNVRGKLETSDPEINDIHRICVQTQRVCMLDSYVDTPWREQAQWWGDARVQAMNTFHLTTDTRLLKRGIRSIAGQETPNGLTFGHAPTRSNYCVLPDFSLIWIITIWDYYFQTGTTDLFVEQLPRIERVLDYFQTEGVGKRGLLKYDERYWLFLDWCNLQKQGHPALLNLWYVYTLQKLCKLAEAADRPREQKKYEQLLEKQQLVTLRHFWDRRQGLFRDTVDANGNKSRRYSIHTQTLAILAGLQPEHHESMIEKRLLPYLRGKKLSSALPSSYWVTYVYEVMTAAGFGAEVLQHIRDHWKNMIRFEGTLETFERSRTAADSHNDAWAKGMHSMTHAWAAHPIYHLARTLGGVTQTAAHWKQIRYRPVTEGTGNMKLKLVIPTPHGNIISKRTRRKDGTIEFSLKCPPAITVVTS